MADRPVTRAALARDGATFTMRCGAWSLTRPIADLPQWIACYVQLRDRGAPKGGKPGRYAAFYAGAVSALEAVAAKTRAVTP